MIENRKPITTRDPGPHPRGRRCAHVDENGVRCITVLNRCHDGDRCYAHSLPVPATLAEQVASFQDLMEQAA